MRKRLLSLILACIMLWCCMVPMLTGCSGGTPENKYTVAEWLSKVEDSFNMLYYTESEPLVQTVRSDSEYYDVVQIAAEWGLISAEDELDFDKPVTKEFCADTLATATNFAKGESFEGIADADSITDRYVEGVNLALNEGIFSLDANGRFDPKYEPTKEEADIALVTARNAWTNFSFDGECYDKSEVKDGVINLGGVADVVTDGVVDADFSVQYTGDTNFIGPDGNYCDNSTKTITFAAGQAPAMQVGTVLAMPGDDVIPMDYAVVVDSIVENADGSVTVNTHNATIDDVYENLNVRYSGDIDFSNAIVITPDGEVLTSDSSAQSMSDTADDEASLDSGLYVFADAEKQLTGSKDKAEFSFKIDKLINFNIALSGKGAEFGVTLKKDFGDATGELKVTEKKDFSIDYDYDYGLIKGLKSFYVKINSDTTEKLKLSLKLNEGKNYTDEYKDLKDLNNFKNFYKALSEDFSKRSKDAKALEQIMNVKLCDVVIPHTPIHFTIRLGATVEGELEFVVEQSETNGIEKVGKKLRIINDVDRNLDVKFDGKMEAYLKVGFELIFLTSIADLGVQGGLGVASSAKVYLNNEATGAVEAEFALPRTLTTEGAVDCGSGISTMGVAMSSASNVDVCLETRAYPILKVYGCSKGTLVGKFLGSIEYEFFGKDTPLAVIHYEVGKGIVDCCTKENSGSNLDIEVGDTVTANFDKYLMAVGEESTAVKMLTIPEGIKIEDIVVTSSDPSIVMVENLLKQDEGIAPSNKLKITLSPLNPLKINTTTYFKEHHKEDAEHFKFTGVTDGVATVTINAGGKTCEVQVVVGNGGIAEVSEGRFVIKNTSMNLKMGESGKVEVESAPEGYTLAECTFSSTDTEVATVDQNGNVTAGSKGGSAIIYISTNDGEYTGACIINVS